MTIYFKNFESDDLEDFLDRVKRSYALNLDNYDLSAIETLNDFAAFINQHSERSINDNCSSQQSFYKLREAIALATGSNGNRIIPSTLLKEALGDSRRRNARRVAHHLGINTSLVKINDTLASFLIFGILLSFIAIFFFGWYALIFTLLFIASYQIASRLADTPAFTTVGDTAKKLAIDNYMIMRRNFSINPLETETILTALLVDVMVLDDINDLVAQGYATAI